MSTARNIKLEKVNIDSLKDLSILINQSLEKEFAKQSESLGILKEVISYSLLSDGKRIRPLLANALSLDLSSNIDKLVPVSLALEYIHCASLIHDDLPALDNDKERRGVPTSHVRFSEAKAILAGDALPAYAVLLISGSNYSSILKEKFTSTLMSAYVDICEGQVRDISNEDDILKTHNLKTASLFKASTCFAAINAEVDDETYGITKNLGESLGFYFQCIDDYIDRFGNDELRGRSGSSDERNGRKTSFTSKENSLLKIESLEVKLHSLIKDLDIVDGYVANIVQQIKARLLF